MGNESLSWPTVLQAPLPSGPFYYHLPMSLPATGEASMVCVLSSPALGGHSLTQTVPSVGESVNKHRQSSRRV